MLPFMRALLAHAKLHAFYLVALWLWGGILVAIKWWIMFDLVACALLAVVATAMLMQHSAQRRSSEMTDTAVRSAPGANIPRVWMTDRS